MNTNRPRGAGFRFELRVALLLFFSLLAPFSPVLAQNNPWRSGPIVYTPLIDQLGNYQANGTGYFVSQAIIASPPQPTAGQRFYLSVYLSAIASPPVGRFMYPHLQLPAGVSIVADPATPLRCLYRPMSGGTQFFEFTNQALNDTSFGANLRIAGCPQPSSAPLPLRSLFNGASGTGVLITRRDPQSSNEAWPMGSYAAYEFLVPVVSAGVLDGFSQSALFRAPTYSMQGDGLSSWAYPQLPLLVHPAGGGSGSADMRVASLNTTTPSTPLNRRVLARCRNDGPNDAQNATCSFTRLPAGASQGCSPTGVQTNLAASGFIDCWAEFPGTPDGDTVEVTATSSTPDPNPQNNGIGISIQPMLGGLVFRSGFEL
jgi:hypothetical protein